MPLPNWIDDYGAYMALKENRPICFTCKCEPHCNHSCQECENCPDCNCISCMEKDIK